MPFAGQTIRGIQSICSAFSISLRLRAIMVFRRITDASAAYKPSMPTPHKPLDQHPGIPCEVISLVSYILIYGPSHKLLLGTHLDRCAASIEEAVWDCNAARRFVIGGKQLGHHCRLELFEIDFATPLSMFILSMPTLQKSHANGFGWLALYVLKQNVSKASRIWSGVSSFVWPFQVQTQC